MTTAPLDVVRPGDVLAGKYSVERVIGRGGMGVVVAAHHIQLDEKVALKFLLPEALENPEAVARFLREARAAVKIKSEHVARVIDVGQLETGSPYMVMEYLEGGDLSAWLRQRGPMPVDQAVDFVLQACEAIAEAHAIGIVHRDLKPANLFCTRRADGQLSIKVLDFGISKINAPGAPGHDMTRTHAVVGSPIYMSPEQMMSSKMVDVRTDVWSLGIILFELVAGRPPFTAESITELAVRVTQEPAPPIRLVRPDAPAELERVVATALQKERERRFQNVGELATALAGLGSRRAQASVERILDTLRAAGPAPDLPSPSGPYAAPTPAAPLAMTPSTAGSWGPTGSTPSRAGGARVVATIAIACVTLAAVGTALVVGARVARRTAPDGPGPAAASIPPDPPASTASPVESPSVGLDPPPAPPATSVAPVPQPVVSSAKAATRSGPALPIPHASASHGAAPAAAVGCDPPTWTDADGHVHIKPGCR